MSASHERIIPVSLQQAIVDTFKVQLGTDTKVSVATTTADETHQSASLLDVVSIMGVSCTGFTGSLALGFPKSTFLNVLEAMLGEKHTDISDSNADACSELLNIIYASARVKINGSGFDFQPAIPATICGKEISLPLGQFSSFMKFSCETPKGSFLMAFCLKRTK